METQNLCPPGRASDSSADVAAFAEMSSLRDHHGRQRPREPRAIGDVLAERIGKIFAESDADREAREQREAREALVRERGRREQMFLRLVHEAGARYQLCTLDSFRVTCERQRTVVTALREFVEELADHLANGTGLVLHGPVGTGKDHLLAAMAKLAVLEHGATVRWSNVQNWFGEVRDAMGDDRRTEREMILSLTSPQVLVLSDPLPPSGALTQHQAAMLYRLLDARYSRGRATWVSINADDSEADAGLGAATWDRMCHGAWKIACQWPSHRRAGRTINGPSDLKVRTA